MSYLGFKILSSFAVVDFSMLRPLDPSICCLINEPLCLVLVIYSTRKYSLLAQHVGLWVENGQAVLFSAYLYNNENKKDGNNIVQNRVHSIYISCLPLKNPMAGSFVHVSWCYKTYVGDMDIQLKKICLLVVELSALRNPSFGNISLWWSKWSWLEIQFHHYIEGLVQGWCL